MNWQTWVAGAGLLAVIVGLSTCVGKLRGEIKRQDAIMAQVEAQRDAAKTKAVEFEQLAADRGKIVASAVERVTKLEAAHEAERKRMSADLAASRARYRRLAASKPANLPDCMAGLDAANKHVSVLDNELRMTTDEKNVLRLALDASLLQIADLETSLKWYKETVNLDEVRFDAVEDWRKARRKKLIIGLTVGMVGLSALSFGVGYWVAQ